MIWYVINVILYTYIFPNVQLQEEIGIIVPPFTLMVGKHSVPEWLSWSYTHRGYWNILIIVQYCITLAIFISYNKAMQYNYLRIIWLKKCTFD